MDSDMLEAPVVASVAPRFKKPNIRALFLPDPSHILVDADLSGADAQVVFAEAGEHETVQRLSTGVKLHAETATAFFGQRFTDAPGDMKNKLSLKGALYAAIKGASHAINYAGSGRTVALNFGWTIAEGERFKRLWFTLHPGVRTWHERTEHELRTTRSTKNAFGYRVHWLDRIDGLLPEALAWQAQSCIAITTYRAAEQIRERFAFVRFKLQVHDSLVFQLPKNKLDELPAIALALAVPIPYKPNPLTIPWKLATSETSWGEAKPWSAAA